MPSPMHGRLVARSHTINTRIPLAKRAFKTGQPSQLNYQGYCFPAGLQYKCLLVRMRCRLRQGEYERLIWQSFCLSFVGLMMYQGTEPYWGITNMFLITDLNQYGYNLSPSDQITMPHVNPAQHPQHPVPPPAPTAAAIPVTIASLQPTLSPRPRHHPRKIKNRQTLHPGSCSRPPPWQSSQG